jgi:hypothetical protein
MKLHSRLKHYLAGIETMLGGLQAAEVESYVEEVLAPTRANLRVRIRFAAGQMLAISEAVVIDDHRLVHLDYRYHCQGADIALLFRYDSTPHFPDLAGFPEHKHVPENVIEAARPELPQVLAEVAGNAIRSDCGPS